MNKKKTKSTAYGNWECKCSTIFRTEEEKKEALRLILIIRRFLCQMKSI